MRDWYLVASAMLSVTMEGICVLHLASSSGAASVMRVRTTSLSSEFSRFRSIICF